MYGANLSKDNFYINNLSKYSYEIVEDNDNLNNFLLKYETLKTKKVNIKESDVIYFFKESKYPRFKFNSNCKNLKTIQIPKADYLVTPILNFVSKSYNINTAIECLLTNNIYFFNHKHYYDACHRLYKKSNEIESTVALLQDKFLIQGNNYRVVKFKYVNDYRNNYRDLINNINDNFDKCINEENLEEYVMSYSENELTDDLYESLTKMLSSSDTTTVELGIKMLNNFDVKKYALKIGSLLRLNQSTIEKNKALQSVGFKNIMSQLNTTWNNLSQSDVLYYYNKLYISSSEENDKDEIRKYIIAELKNRMLVNYNINIKNIQVPLNVTLEIN